MDFVLDAELFRRVYGWFQDSPFLPVLGWLTHLGSSKVVLLLAFGGFLERCVRRGPPLLPWLGVPIAAGLTGWIKEAVARPRPSEIFADLGIVASAKGYAFPSGHAALSFALAVALCIRWPKASILWFSAAGLVALSRVALGLHWPSDVVAGALLGGVVGIGLALFEKWWIRRWRKRCHAS
jgi:undecaprenyl-diphosphatase